MPNKFYSEGEKNLLISLVDQFKLIIECKKTDGVSVRKKQETWDKICANYNSNDVTPRNCKQLKKLWDNIKQRQVQNLDAQVYIIIKANFIYRTRKSDTERRNYTLQTGGGPPPQDNDDPFEQQVRAILPTIDYEIKNNVDSIALFDSSKNVDEMTTSSITIYKEPGPSQCLTIIDDHDYNSTQFFQFTVTVLTNYYFRSNCRKR